MSTLPEHLSSSPVFNGVCVTRCLVLYVMFCRSLFVLLFFLFWSSCCFVLRFTDSDYLPLLSSNSSYVYRKLYGIHRFKLVFVNSSSNNIVYFVLFYFFAVSPLFYHILVKLISYYKNKDKRQL